MTLLLNLDFSSPAPQSHMSVGHRPNASPKKAGILGMALLSSVLGQNYSSW